MCFIVIVCFVSVFFIDMQLTKKFPLPAAASAVTEDKKKRPAGGGLTGGRTVMVAGSVAAAALCMRYLPEHMWGVLVIVSTPALLAVQLPQIWKNWKQKHTGELATLTVLLAFLGSSVRVATTIAVRIYFVSGLMT